MSAIEASGSHFDIRSETFSRHFLYLAIWADSLSPFHYPWEPEAVNLSFLCGSTDRGVYVQLVCNPDDDSGENKEISVSSGRTDADSK